MAERWQLLSERPGSADYLAVTARRYRLPDGSEADWDIFGGDRSVAVLAITDNDQVILARQYRPAPDGVLDELPGGLVEPNEAITGRVTRAARGNRICRPSRDRGDDLAGVRLSHAALRRSGSRRSQGR